MTFGPISVAAVSRNHTTFILMLETAIDKQSALAGEFAQADVRMNPKGFRHRSGNIARSTEYKIIRTARGRLIKILNTAKYARPLEKGHKPFFVKPRSGKALRFVMNGKVAFSRGHMIPETQPTFFLKTATRRAFGKFVMGMNAESRSLAASFKKMRA